MKRNRFAMRITVAPLLLLAAALAVPAAAQTAPAEQTQTAAPAVPAKSVDEVKRLIETEFGVTVLRVRPTEREDGSPAYAVTVMNPGGDRNSAFVVSTLEVDARTGALIPQFRHAADGYRSSDAGRFEPNRSTDNPAVLRGHTWR